MSSKERLVIVLEQIAKRYNSMLFSKMVLLEQQQEPQSAYIRHYDIQCEAVQTLADTLNTKIKAIKFRCFYLIKFFRKEEMFKRKPRNQNASYVHNHSTGSYFERNGTGREYKQLLAFPKTSRNQLTSRNGFEKTSQMLSDIDYSMSALMKKMKHLNKNIIANGQDDPESPQLSLKVQKRNLILSKLNQLQNSLSDLINQDQPHLGTGANIGIVRGGGIGNLGHITSSQITLRHPVLQEKNSKTSRVINRTFCVSSREDRRF